MYEPYRIKVAESPIILTNTLNLGTAVEVVEEAVIDSILKATSVTGYGGHRVEAIPVEALQKILTKHP